MGKPSTKSAKVASQASSEKATTSKTIRKNNGMLQLVLFALVQLVLTHLAHVVSVQTSAPMTGSYFAQRDSFYWCSAIIATAILSAALKSKHASNKHQVDTHWVTFCWVSALVWFSFPALVKLACRLLLITLNLNGVQTSQALALALMCPACAVLIYVCSQPMMLFPKVGPATLIINLLLNYILWGIGTFLPRPVLSGTMLMSILLASLPFICYPTVRRGACLFLWAAFAVCIHFLPLHKPFPHTSSSKKFEVLSSTECWAGGYLSVVSTWLDEDYKYAVMKFDHSIIGGIYTFPEGVANQSIYNTFYLQDAVWLFNKQGTRMLNIGLGIGFAASAMQQRNVTVDVVELHEEVYLAAQQHFGFQPTGTIHIADALQVIDSKVKGNTSSLGSYDFILHDVFSGGGVPSALFTHSFFTSLQALMTHQGVLAVNYVGLLDGCINCLANLLSSVFTHVRLFKESLEDLELQNYVFFCSMSYLDPAKPTLVDFNHDPLRGEMMFYFHRHELGLPLSVAERSWEHCFGASGQMDVAALHWKYMNESFPPEFWLETY